LRRSKWKFLAHKATGTTLVLLEANDNKSGVISTSFTVQVDTSLSGIDQDLKTIFQKTYPNPAGEITFVSITTDNPQNLGYNFMTYLQ
jgi:hypothetical protein